MGSLRIDLLRKSFPGKTNAEIAEAIATKDGYVTVVQYKSNVRGDYDNFGCCYKATEVEGYFTSPSCHNVEIIYDRFMRSTNGIRESIRKQFSLARSHPCRLCTHFRPFKQQCDLINKSISLEESNSSTCKHFKAKE